MSSTEKSVGCEGVLGPSRSQCSACSPSISRWSAAGARRRIRRPSRRSWQRVTLTPAVSSGGYHRAVSSHTQRGASASRSATYAGRSARASSRSASPSTTSTRSAGRRESETRVIGSASPRAGRDAAPHPLRHGRERATRDRRRVRGHSNISGCAVPTSVRGSTCCPARVVLPRTLVVTVRGTPCRRGGAQRRSRRRATGRAVPRRGHRRSGGPALGRLSRVSVGRPGPGSAAPGSASSRSARPASCGAPEGSSSPSCTTATAWGR